jgi:hypothetical protein
MDHIVLFIQKQAKNSRQSAHLCCCSCQLLLLLGSVVAGHSAVAGVSCKGPSCWSLRCCLALLTNRGLLVEHGEAKEQKSKKAKKQNESKKKAKKKQKKSKKKAKEQKSKSKKANFCAK